MDINPKFLKNRCKNEGQLLDLAWCGLLDEDIDTITDFLQANKKINELNFYGNNVTDLGAENLINFLISSYPNISITKLNLGYNDITDNAIASLCKVTGLKELSIKDISISMETLNRLKEMNLQKLSTNESASINKNNSLSIFPSFTSSNNISKSPEADEIRRLFGKK